MDYPYVVYGDGLTDYESPEDDEFEHEEEVKEEDKAHGGSNFNVLEDMDTVLFLRVNSFFHSISN